MAGVRDLVSDARALDGAEQILVDAGTRDGRRRRGQRRPEGDRALVKAQGVVLGAVQGTCTFTPALKS